MIEEPRASPPPGYAVLVSGGTHFSGPSVRVSYRDRPIREVLGELLRPLVSNFSIDSEVTGSVTLDLVDTPSDLALLLVMRYHGLRHRIEGGTLFVYPEAQESAWRGATTRTVPLRCLLPAEAAPVLAQAGALGAGGRASPVASLGAVLVDDDPLVLRQVELLLRIADAFGSCRGEAGS